MVTGFLRSDAVRFQMKFFGKSLSFDKELYVCVCVRVRFGLRKIALMISVRPTTSGQVESTRRRNTFSH